jgi:hypothetical protein
MVTIEIVARHAGPAASTTLGLYRYRFQRADLNGAEHVRALPSRF